MGKQTPMHKESLAYAWGIKRLCIGERTPMHGQVQATNTHNTNSSSHPDGDWWGQRVLLTATIGGFAVKRWLTFANPMP